MPEGVERHKFIGRFDRDCEICGYPDRNPVHIWDSPDHPDGERPE